MDPIHSYQWAIARVKTNHPHLPEDEADLMAELMAASNMKMPEWRPHWRKEHPTMWEIIDRASPHEFNILIHTESGEWIIKTKTGEEVTPQSRLFVGVRYHYSGISQAALKGTRYHNHYCGASMRLDTMGTTNTQINNFIQETLDRIRQDWLNIKLYNNTPYKDSSHIKN